MKQNKLIIATIMIGMGLASSVQARTYNFEITDFYNSPGSDDAGDITQLSTSYNTDNEVLSWQSTIIKTNDTFANAFWLVLSDGPDPMINRNEYAIFYGDTYSGNLSAYVYNGLNNGQSWNTPGEFIQTFSGAFATDTVSSGDLIFSFSVDVSTINDYVPTSPGINNWNGALFGDNIGIWYHPVHLDKPSTYNNDGSLAAFPEIISGFYDTFDQKTTVTDVPEPGTLALASLGLVGTFIGRRRRNH